MINLLAWTPPPQKWLNKDSIEKYVKSIYSHYGSVTMKTSDVEINSTDKGINDLEVNQNLEEQYLKYKQYWGLYNIFLLVLPLFHIFNDDKRERQK